MLAGAGVKENGEMDFATFKKVMLDLEDALNDDDDEDEEDVEEVSTSKESASPVVSAGKGFARSEAGSNVAPASSSGQGAEEDFDDEDEELTEEEEEAIAQEIFEELKSKSGKVSVKNLMAYETVADLLKCMLRNLANHH